LQQQQNRTAPFTFSKVLPAAQPPAQPPSPQNCTTKPPPACVALPLRAAGATGGFAAGEKGLKQFVRDGELQLRKVRGAGAG
jgi:hypothetical protein